MIKKIYNSRFFVFLIGFLYSRVYYEGYIKFLFKYFDYAGFGIVDGRLNDRLFTVITFIISLIPLLVFRGVKKISSFLSIFIYYLLYVPIIFTFYFNLKGTTEFVLAKQILFMVGMVIIFLSDRFYFKRMPVFPSRFDMFQFIMFLCVGVTIYIAIVYRSNLKLVSFEDVYVQRAANENLGSDNITGYLSVWLLNVLVPICIVYSLFAKKKIYFVVGTVACIILYMATAAKSALFMPFIMYGLYRLLFKKDMLKSFNIIGLALVVVLLFSLMFDFNVFSSILWARTVGNAGILTKSYYEFFEFNPRTYFSHINFVNAVTQMYPYDKQLGSVIGNYYWDKNTNANANFWATDGIAAVGDFGIILSSVLLFFIFVIFNSISRHYKLLFMVLILIPYTLSLLNTSLFSSLLSGGSFLIFLFLSFDSILKNKNVIE